MSEEENEDGIYPDDDVFQEGESVLITKEDESLAIGLFVGIMDFGLITKNTHRTEKIADRFSPAFRNDFRVGLMKKTVEALKEMAVDEEISLVGLRKKNEIIEEMTDVMLARAENEMEEREAFITLKRPVLSFLPWPEIKEVRRLSEYLEEQDLQEFSTSLDMFSGIEAVGPDVSPEASKVSDE